MLGWANFLFCFIKLPGNFTVVNTKFNGNLMYHEHSLYVGNTASFNLIPMLDQFITFDLLVAVCVIMSGVVTWQKLKQLVKEFWCAVWLPCNRGNKGRGFCETVLCDMKNSAVLKHLPFPGKPLTKTHIPFGNKRSDINTELSRPNLPTWCSICIDSSILILISLEALTCSGRAFWTPNLTFLICFRLDQPPSLLRYRTQW